MIPQWPWRYRLYRALWQVVDWVFPPACLGCGMWGDWFCPTCVTTVPWLTPPWCVRCGQPLSSAEAATTEALCRTCCHRPLPLTQARALAAMEGIVQAAIHALKYRGNIGVAVPLAVWLSEMVRAQGWPVEAVVPVPLGAQRRRERGYNQAALLAYPVALALGVPYLARIVQRRRETRSQVGLSAMARWENVRDAFVVRSPLRVRRVLVVDDVMTTGATLAAVAQALRQAGATEVWGITVARAVLREGDQPMAAEGALWDPIGEA